MVLLVGLLQVSGMSDYKNCTEKFGYNSGISQLICLSYKHIEIFERSCISIFTML